MQKVPVLLPFPKYFHYTEGYIDLSIKNHILLESDFPQELTFIANTAQKILVEDCNVKLAINASPAIPQKGIGIRLCKNHKSNSNIQSYRLNINSENVFIEAQTNQGIFYGVRTLSQLLYYFQYCQEEERLPAGTLPCLEIIDWPDYANRGVLLDISRDKVPTMETVFKLVDLLSSWKINQFQLYTEHTFAYQQHPDVWVNASPFTAEEILVLDSYCRERYVELVPCQNSFGHLEHWLNHPKYKHLAEAPEGFSVPWRHQDGAFGLCPIDSQSILFVSGLYDELLPNFSSRQFNVGCDETFDLGFGRSKIACEQYGTGRVYLNFLRQIYENVTKRGYTMQFWGDIVMAHPELVPELPKDSIALEWGYEANHPFSEHGRLFHQNEIPFYVCPGTSSWNSIAGRTDNCLENLANAALGGIKNEAKGYLNTDWGDDGHWQQLPISYLGFAAGAAFAWSFDSNKQIDIKYALSLFAFKDSANVYGPLAFDLGNVYREIGVEPENNSALFLVMQLPATQWKSYLDSSTAERAFKRALERIDIIMNNLSNNKSIHPDKEIIQREFLLTVSLLRHACERGLYGYAISTTSKKDYLFQDLLNIIDEYWTIWLLRNRPGGLKDSLKHFNIALDEYRQN